MSRSPLVMLITRAALLASALAGVATAFVAPLAPTQRNTVALSATVEPPTIPAIGMNPLEPDSYVVLGLASVFTRKKGAQGVDEVFLVEPLTAGTLETLDLGVPTSYRRVAAYRCGDLMIGDPAEPTGLRTEAYANLVAGFDGALLCDNALERTMAAARTFRRRPEAMLVDLDAVCDDYNFSTERKRIINEVYEPSFDDNVKQDASIDVYGRGGTTNSDTNLADEIERLANS